MIQTFVMGMIFYSALCLPLYIVTRYVVMRKRTFNGRREAIMLLFFVYCVSIFSQTIVPNFLAESAGQRVNLIPFQTIGLYLNQLQGPLAGIAFYNLAGNILLFVPFGFFIPLLWKKYRTVAARLLMAVVIPLFIEGTQYFIGRSTDIDDVILNAIAIYLGTILFEGSKKMMKFFKNK